MVYYEAIQALVKGSKVARKVWDGRYLIALSPERSTHLVRNEDGMFCKIRLTNPYMLAYDIKEKTWVVNVQLSIEDKLADDWFVIKKEYIC